MEALQDALAAVPYKYLADFTTLIQDASFQQRPAPAITNDDCDIYSPREEGVYPILAIGSFFFCVKWHNSATLQAIQEGIVL
jgi:hypothetical protein